MVMQNWGGGGGDRVHYGLSQVVNAGGSRCNIKNCEEINKDCCLIKIVVCFFEANRNFACCLILLFDFSQSGRKSMSDSGDQTNLGQEKNPSKQLLKKTLFPMKGLIFITSFPTFLSPSNLAAKRGLISSHFAQNSTLFGITEKGLFGSYTY